MIYHTFRKEERKYEIWSLKYKTSQSTQKYRPQSTTVLKHQLYPTVLQNSSFLKKTKHWNFFLFAKNILSIRISTL